MARQRGLWIIIASGARCMEEFVFPFGKSHTHKMHVVYRMKYAFYIWFSQCACVRVKTDIKDR